MSNANTSNAIRNFARAIKMVAPRSVSYTQDGMRFASALTLKEKFFPRSDFQIFSRNLRAAISAGLIRAVNDADSCYIVIG